MRAHGSASRLDIKLQPRILQPVSDQDNMTGARGWNDAYDLSWGDLVWAATGTGGTGVPRLVVVKNLEASPTSTSNGYKYEDATLSD